MERTPASPSTPRDGTWQAECPYVTGNTTRYCTLTPLTLTDAEREAIEYFAGFQWTIVKTHAATLRGLLERTR